MPCSNCNPPYPVATFVFSGTSPCTNCDDADCPQGILSSHCVYNDGPPLTCIGADTNERLDLVLQKIDAQLCTIGGGNPFPTYNTYCLGAVANQQQFVERISQQFCTLRSDFTTFTGTTFPTAIDEINTTIDGINHPGLGSFCDILVFEAGDTIADYFSRISDAICSLYTDAFDVSGVQWDQCTTVTDPPENIIDGLQFLVDQICNINAGTGTVLPTFDNTGTCLDTPTATDSLVSTILKIRSKVCAAPAFNPGSYTAGCIQVSGASSLDDVLQALITELTGVLQVLPRSFDNTQFTVEPVDPGNLCLGTQVSLTGVGGGGEDRYVAVDNADNNPGTLVDKLTAGTGMSFDTTTNPGEMILNVTSVADEKVKTNAADPTAGYLEDKVTGQGTPFITVTTPVVSNKVAVTASLDISAVATAIIDILEDDEDLKARLCALIATCPSPCSAPTNVSVQYVP